jgi:uncharacterized protein YbaR (Trm112 family)
MLDESLLRILACPIDKGALLYFPGTDVLFNPRLGRTYPVTLDIPVLLAEAGEQLAETARRALLHRAAHGDARPTAGASISEVLATDVY